MQFIHHFDCGEIFLAQYFGKQWVNDLRQIPAMILIKSSRMTLLGEWLQDVQNEFPVLNINLILVMCSKKRWLHFLGTHFC